jgi:hypothetical protein
MAIIHPSHRIGNAASQGPGRCLAESLCSLELVYSLDVGRFLTSDRKLLSLGNVTKAMIFSNLDGKNLGFAL